MGKWQVIPCLSGISSSPPLKEAASIHLMAGLVLGNRKDLTSWDQLLLLHC